MKSRSLLLACLGGLPLSWLFAATVRGADIDIVLENIAVSPPARVAFTEQRNNPLFENPLELSGYLDYLAVGKMRKVIQSPFKENYLIDNGSIAVERDGSIRKLSARASRSLNSMLSGLEAVLSGDHRVLEQEFEFAVHGCVQRWTLTMQPRSKKVQRELSDLVVKGDDERISSIRINLPGEEWHLMQLHETSTQ